MALFKACDQTRAHRARNLKDTTHARHTATRDRLIFMGLCDIGLRTQVWDNLSVDDSNLSQNKIIADLWLSAVRHLPSLWLRSIL